MTPKQTAVIARLRREPTLLEAGEAFFRCTDHSRSTWAEAAGLSIEGRVQFADLLANHTIQSRIPSPLLEGLWVDGAEDYPLGLLVRNLERDNSIYAERAWALLARLRDPDYVLHLRNIVAQEAA